MLKDFARRRRQDTGSLEVEAEDQMDDGTPIRLKVQINEEQVTSISHQSVEFFTVNLYH